MSKNFYAIYKTYTKKIYKWLLFFGRNFTSFRRCASAKIRTCSLVRYIFYCYKSLHVQYCFVIYMKVSRALAISTNTWCMYINTYRQTAFRWRLRDLCEKLLRFPSVFYAWLRVLNFRYRTESPGSISYLNWVFQSPVFR